MRRRSGERRSARRAASVCIAALLALAESATDVEAQVDGLFSPVEPAFARRFPSPEVTGTPGIATLRSRVVRIDVEALADARAGVAAAEAAGRGDAATLTLNLNLFDDVVFSGIVERTNPTASGTGYVLSGRLDEVEPGTLTLLVYEEGVVGTVRTPTATYSIRPLGDGAHAVGQIDTSGLPPGGEPLVPRSPSPDATPGPSGADRPVAAADDGSVIDVAVFHTPAARTGVRDVTGVSGITALIDLMFENANAAYRDSGAIQRIRLVRTQGVDYVASDSQDDLRRLTEKDDGFMDEVHQVRDEYGADLVHLITANKDVCGRAWQLLYTSYDFAPNGFGLTGYNCELGDYSFSHELGHNMGLRHRESVSYNAAVESAASRDTDPQPAAFAQRAYREAIRRGFDTADCQVVIGDGAPWIWNVAAEQFPGAIEIVDIYHAKQHLCDVAKAIYGPGTDLADQWARDRRAELDTGRLCAVVAALRIHVETTPEARKCIHYVFGNRHRMRYPQFRARGLCVSSGVVEAGCKQIGARLKRAGMRWTVAGANAIIALRCCILSGRFEEFWERRAANAAVSQ